MFEPCALSSACLVSCWSLVFVSRHSWLEFQFCIGVRTLALRVLSRCVSVWSRSVAHSPVHMSCGVHAVCVFIGCVHSCYVLCCVARSLCISLAACFHVVMSCVNTRLMRILISRVRVLFCTWLVICFAGHVLVFLFCVSTWLLS